MERGVDKKVGSKKNQDLEIILERLKNSDLVAELRKKYGITPGGFPFFKRDKKGEIVWKSAERARTTWERQLTHEQFFNFEKDIGGLLKKLKIPLNRFYWVVLAFVRGGMEDVSAGLPQEHSPIEVGLTKDELSGIPQVTLTLDADVKRSDLNSKQLWERIKYLQGKLHDSGSLKQRKRPLFEKMAIIYKWHFEDGLTHREIRERAEKELGWKIKHVEDVNTHLQRYKKIVGKKY